MKGPVFCETCRCVNGTCPPMSEAEARIHEDIYRGHKIESADLEVEEVK